MIQNEEEILDYLDLPSLPKRAWDGKSSFDKGVAKIGLRSGYEAYAVVTFDSEVDAKPRVIKAFVSEPFVNVGEIYVVPSYMATDLDDADLDEQSKKKAQEIVMEAKAIENLGVENVEVPTSEWVFPEIKTKDEAIAWLRAYNTKHRIKGKVPTNPETIKVRLYAIQQEINK